jgi:hypothetical protein
VSRDQFLSNYVACFMAHRAALDEGSQTPSAFAKTHLNTNVSLARVACACAVNAWDRYQESLARETPRNTQWACTPHGGG